jgi:hypothetical protein
MRMSALGHWRPRGVIRGAAAIPPNSGREPIQSTIGYIKGGMLRPLAVTTASRADALPNMPTVGEFVPGFDDAGRMPKIHRRRNREVGQGD